jgi:hypothetical protein
MRFLISVRFRTDDSIHCLWHVMRERKGRGIYCCIGERYPTSFTKRTLGTAIAAVWQKYGGSLAQVKVTPEPNYDQENQSGNGSSSGYSEACGVYN